MGYDLIPSGQKKYNNNVSTFAIKDRVFVLTEQEYGPVQMDLGKMRVIRKIKMFDMSNQSVKDISFVGSQWENHVASGLPYCFISDAVSNLSSALYVYLSCNDKRSIYQINYNGDKVKLMDIDSTLGIAGNMGGLMIDSDKNLLVFTSKYENSKVNVQLKKILGNQLVDVGGILSYAADPTIERMFDYTTFYKDAIGNYYYFFKDLKKPSYTDPHYYIYNSNTQQKIELSAQCESHIISAGLRLDKIFCYKVQFEQVSATQSRFLPHDIYSYSLNNPSQTTKLTASGLLPLYFHTYFIAHSQLMITQTPNVPQDSTVKTWLSADLGQSFEEVQNFQLVAFNKNTLAMSETNRVFYASSPDMNDMFSGKANWHLHELVCQ